MSVALNPTIPAEDARRWMQELDNHPIAVPQERKVEWLNKIFERDPDRVDWHIRRSWCCTATRVGTLVAEYENNDAAFNTTARDVCAEILLRSVPFRPTAAMRRGLAMEDTVRQMFLRGDWLERFGFSKDTKIERITDDYLTHSTLDRWVESGVVYNGSPDDIIRIGGPGGIIVIVDYKAPTSVDESDDEFLEAYELQLAHNRHGFERQTGIKVTGGLLVQLDWKNWDVVVSAVDPRTHEKNVRRIQEAASHYWLNYVSKDELPEFENVVRLEFDSSSEEGRAIQGVSERLTLHKVGAKLFANQEAEDKKTLAAALDRMELPDEKATITAGLGDSLKIGVKKVLDVKAIKAAAEEREVEIPTVEEPTDEIDSERAMETLMLHGLTVPYKVTAKPDYEAAVRLLQESGLERAFTKGDYNIRFDRKKGAPGTQAHADVTTRVAETLKPISDRLLRQIQESYNSDTGAPSASEGVTTDRDVGSASEEAGSESTDGAQAPAPSRTSKPRV